MKTLNVAGNRNQRARRIGAWLLGACLTSGSVLLAADTEPAKSDAEKKPEKSEASADELNNWIDLTVGGAFVHGDPQAYRQRFQNSRGAFGGVEDFHMEQNVGTNSLLKIDGRAIFDNHDYLFKVELADPNKGYLRAGYREFRTYYDGSGGYSPRSNVWLRLENYPDHFWVDHGEAWFEGALTLPSWPELHLKYSHFFNDGTKDSTSWGDYNLNSGTPNAAVLRGIAPTYRDIDESRDIIQADAKKTIGKTQVGVGLRYDMVNTDDSLNIHRRPGELPPLSTPGADRYVTQKNGFDSDIWTVHSMTETRFSDKVLLTTGYSFTTLDTDLSGSRIYGDDYDGVYDPTFGRRQPLDAGFINLSGGSEKKQHVGNLNLMLSPLDNFVIVPSVRVESVNQNGNSTFTATDVAYELPNEVTEHSDLLYVTENLEARYTGIRNWAFYARGEWLEGSGTLKEEQKEGDPLQDVILQRNTDADRFTQKYVLGVNWYPLSRLNLGAQYYHKIRNNDFDNKQPDSTANVANSVDRYPAYMTGQDFTTDDVNFRVTWRPLNNLTLVSRYDYQFSTIDTTFPGLSEEQSEQVTSHIFSQSISWTPLSRLFLQGNINYVLDKTDTPANDWLGTNRIVLDSKNNYWNASVTAGYALSDKTDLQATYFYYRADNFENNSLQGQPYGAGAEEHGVTVALSHQIKKNIRWTLRYGFFTSHDELAGGHNDYDAHVVSTSVQYRF